MDQLIKQLKTLSKKNSNIILAGDFNVLPTWATFDGGGSAG